MHGRLRSRRRFAERFDKRRKGNCCKKPAGRRSQYLSTWNRNPYCPLGKEKPVWPGRNNFGKIGIRGVRPHRNDSSGYELSHRDRKSTRLNSSHANISYAVFCLKKKKI